MRTQKHFLLRALRFSLFLWMQASQNKIPICIRNVTWYDPRNHVYKSQLKVCGCLNEKLHIKEKGNKSHHHYQVFQVHRGSIDQNLSPSMTKETYNWLFFCKQPPRLEGLITAKEEGDASSKFNTYTNNHFLVYLTGHLKTKPISSVSYMTVRAGIIKGVRQTNTC